MTVEKAIADYALNEALAVETLKRMRDKAAGRREVTAPFAFNPYLYLRSSDLQAVLRAIVPKLGEVRDRRFRNIDMPRIDRTLGAIIANGLVAGARNFTHYSRNKAKFKRGDAYVPEWLTSHNLRRQIADLARADLLTEVRAPQGLDVEKESVFAATPALVALCAQLSITAESVLCSEEDAVIVMKDFEDKRVIQFDRNAEPYARMAAELRAFNAFLSRQCFATAVPLNRSDIDFARTRMFRIFQGGPDLHGRFYGGFWQKLKREERPQITINGNATIERDFRGFVVAALYHQAGLTFEGDPYNISSIREAYEADGRSWPDTRAIIKTMVQVVINGSDLWRHSDKLPVARGMSLKQAQTAILEFHRPISSRFSRTCGLRIMNVDARIAERVLRLALSSEKVTLPIHDGFITSENDVQWLENAMISSYYEELGFSPDIH